MTRKGGLGRGLDALIPSGDNHFETGVISLPVGSIQPNPRQPRHHFNPDEISGLADSIREHGILQPLIVSSTPGSEQFTLIAGERRLMAARQAGLETVPAIIREAGEQEYLELALIENVQRSDLSPLEAAEAYRQLTEEFKLSHEDVAKRVGKSRVAVTNTLRLLKLPETVQKALAEGQITEGHARALLALATPYSQVNALQTIIRGGLNVRQTEELVRRLSGQKPVSEPRPALPPELEALEDRLRARLGTKVSLRPTKKGGTMVIHYYSDEELDALLDRIMGQ
jgi:ParB family chromosome partitioning protein